MLKNYKILAIIPARGGSRGVPKKNIKNINGEPLIAYSIKNALNSTYIDTLIVSTDNHEIASIANRYGASTPFLRPKKYALDTSPNSDVIEHAVHWFKKKHETFDIIVWLEPTSPLRKKNDIDAALKLFGKHYNRADTLVSVGQVHLEHPAIVKTIQKGYVTPFIRSKTGIYQRQQLAPAYFPYGVIYIAKIKSYLRHKTFYQKRTIPYILKRWQNYEIDDALDFTIIETIMQLNTIN